MTIHPIRICLLACIAALTPVVGVVRALGQTEKPGEDAARSVMRVIGDVTAVDAGESQITVQSESGDAVTVVTGSLTACLIARPGARDLSGATPIGCAEITVGDRVLARSARPFNGKTLIGRQIVIMKRTAIAEKQDQERAEWRRRGVAGVVKSLDPAAQEMTLEVRSVGGAQEIVVSTKERAATFLRYAAGSSRFADAKPSSFAEMKIGDQARALGDRTPDGSRVVAEKVVAGAFRTVVGKIQSVRSAENEIVIRRLARQAGESEELTFVLGPETMLRRLPQETGERLASQRNGQRGPGPSRSTAVRTGREEERPREESEEGRTRGGRTGMGGGAPSLSDLFERLPSITAADLLPNEYIAVAVTDGESSARSQATKLLAGVEPLLRETASRYAMAQGATAGVAPGAPDLDLGMGLPE